MVRYIFIYLLHFFNVFNCALNLNLIHDILIILIIVLMFLVIFIVVQNKINSPSATIYDLYTHMNLFSRRVEIL